MSAQRSRSPVIARQPRMFVIASGAYLLQLIAGCGSGGASSGTPGAESGASAAGSAAAGNGTAGSNTLGGGSSLSGAGTSDASAGASAGGTAGTGGSPGASGSAGTAANAGAGSAGTNSAAGSGGAAGSAGSAGAGSCSTPPPASTLVGWASQSGMSVTTTTGGGNATPVTVTTLAALASAVSGSTAKVIYVTGKLAAGKVSIGSNKTIVGLCGAELHGHFGLSGSSNVILRNLKIVGYAVGNCSLDPDYDSTVGCSSGNDAVTIGDKAHHIWVDHCDISDGTDGNLDITQGADFVTVSWTKFHYSSRADNTGNDSTGAEGHRFSNLIGAADNVAIDVGHLNVTWHHDWWADNVNQRMPRTRAGKIHLFNDLFTAAGDSYCTNAGQGASLLVENSVYSGVKAPFQLAANAVTLLSKGNTFPGSTGNTTGSGSGFTPPYAYTPDSTTDLQAAIQANAGPQ
jgi:pectate lyase